MNYTVPVGYTRMKSDQSRWPPAFAMQSVRGPGHSKKASQRWRSSMEAPSVTSVHTHLPRRDGIRWGLQVVWDWPQGSYQTLARPQTPIAQVKRVTSD